ncbi:MAG: hypothetical protein QMD88_04705 [Coprothermobacterota bacterium]|nr:hypothetical protein [Coprothermobacterota bacterium]
MSDFHGLQRERGKRFWLSLSGSGVVLTALEAKDYQTAYSLQTKEFKDQMPLEIFSASIEQGLSEFQIVSQTYEIVKEEIKGDLAYVSYRIVSTTRDGKKIEGQGVYTLKREEKNWRIDLRAVTP